MTAEPPVSDADRITRVIRRGRETGEFDHRLPRNWLVTAAITLAHTAAEEQGNGNLTPEAATEALRISLLRLLGTTSPGTHSG